MNATQPNQSKMKTAPFLKMFKSESKAMEFMRLKNTACRRAGNMRDLYVVTDGPENDYAVMDIAAAIELGGGYTWEG